MDKFDPGKCGDCPMIKHFFDEIEGAQEHSQRLADSLMSQVVDDIVAPMVYAQMEQIQMETMLHDEGIDSPRKLASGIRKRLSKTLDETDNFVEERRLAAESLKYQCSGPLKMRARKAGREITATICNSPSLPLGEGCDPIHTHRKLDQE